MLTRRVLVAALPALLAGVLLIALERAGWYDLRHGAALVVVANIGIVGLVGLIGLAIGSRAARPETNAAARVALSQREDLGTILRNTPTALFLKDLHGRYSMVSAAFEQMHGIPAGTAAGRSDAELHDPARHAEIVRRDRAVVAASGPLVFEDELPGEHGLRTYVTTIFAVVLPLKIWNNTRNEAKLQEQQRLLMHVRDDDLRAARRFRSPVRDLRGDVRDHRVEDRRPTVQGPARRVAGGDDLRR